MAHLGDLLNAFEDRFDLPAKPVVVAFSETALLPGLGKQLCQGASVLELAEPRNHQRRDLLRLLIGGKVTRIRQ